MSFSLRLNVFLWRIVISVIVTWIHDGVGTDFHHSTTPTDRSTTGAVSIHSDYDWTTNAIESKHDLRPSIRTSVIQSSNHGSSLQQTIIGVYPTPSLDSIFSQTGAKRSGTSFPTIELSRTLEPPAALLTNQYSTITKNNELVITTTPTISRISATVSPGALPFSMMLSTSDLTRSTERQLENSNPVQTPNSNQRRASAYTAQTMTTISYFTSNSQYSRQLSSQSVSSRIPKMPSSETNLTTDRLKGAGNFNTSINVGWTATTPMNSTTTYTNQVESNHSTANHVVIVAVSLVIGLFGMSALILRIGNRWKKRMILIEERRRERTKDSYHKQAQKRTSVDKPLTIRIPSIINVKTTGNQSLRRSTVKKTDKKGSGTKTIEAPSSLALLPKRNRTLEALIEIGALPNETLCADSNKHANITTTERELLSNVCMGKWPNAFDNLALDFDSQEELSFNVRRTFLPIASEFKISDDEINNGVRQTVCSIDTLSDEKDSSGAQSCTELTLENSETESASDFKRICHDKRRKNVKFARRSMSNDSGFIDNIRLHDIRSQHVTSETIVEELTTSMTAADNLLDYSDDSQPDGLGGLLTSSARDRTCRRGSKRKRPQNQTTVCHGESPDADQSSSETGGNDTPSDDQNNENPLGGPTSISDSFAYENELAFSGTLNRHYNSVFRRTKSREHWQRSQKACDVSTQTVETLLSPIRWVYGKDELVMHQRSETDLDIVGPIYLVECLPDYDKSL